MFQEKYLKPATEVTWVKYPSHFREEYISITSITRVLHVHPETNKFFLLVVRLIENYLLISEVVPQNCFVCQALSNIAAGQRFPVHFKGYLAT